MCRLWRPFVNCRCQRQSTRTPDIGALAGWLLLSLICERKVTVTPFGLCPVQQPQPQPRQRTQQNHRDNAQLVAQQRHTRQQHQAHGDKVNF